MVLGPPESFTHIHMFGSLTFHILEGNGRVIPQVAQFVKDSPHPYRG